jgi:hypothetical protein
VESAASTAVESAAAVETATTMEATIASESVASPIAAPEAAVESAPAVPVSVAAVEAASVVPVSVVPTAEVAATVVASTVVAVVPGARADEDAAHKVVRPVVSIRSASIGVVIVIPVCADRRSGYVTVTGTNPNSHRNLGGCAHPCYPDQYSQQRKIF